MFRARIGRIANATILIVFSTLVCSGQKVNVKIVQRQNNETGYSGYIPGHIYSTSDTNLSGGSSTNGNVDLSSGYYHSTSDTAVRGTTTTHGTITAPREVSYSVTGATFSLLLPDGRIAVVNCVSKYSPKGDHVNRRSCRMPLVDDIEAEFKGKNAKLFWPVSLDGKKFESETYKILGVLDR